MDNLWTKNYQSGVPAEVDVEAFTSLVHLFASSCQKFANRVAFSNLGTSITYQTLQQYSQNFAGFLQQLNLVKGSRIALMMPNLLQYPVALFGALQAGLVVVNTNPLYTADELSHQLNDSGCDAVVVLANFAHTLEKALPKTSVKRVIITEVGDLFPCIKRFMVNKAVRYIKKMVPSYHLPQAMTFNQAIYHHYAFQTVSLNHQDLAFLQYTGGTTGGPKGAMLTHGNMVANVQQASAWINALASDKPDIIVTALPLYHIFSLLANCLTFLKMGATNILITNPRDLPRFINQIKKSKFTAVTGVNTLFNALINHPKFKQVDCSQLKLALSGGMALQSSVAKKWAAVTNAPILEAYGLTETSPAVTINPLYLKDYNGSIGLPIPSTEVSIRDDNEQELPLGQTGELCVKGPQVMQGYWHQPEETALVFTKDGFLKTGDIAYINDQGFIYIVDRKKDMIVVSGFNVYPNEIEQVIGLMPEVAEVGVVGVSCHLKEKVKACIVKRDPNLSQAQVIDHCRKHLTAYKIPKIVEFYSELPKTNVGKILRRALR